MPSNWADLDLSGGISGKYGVRDNNTVIVNLTDNGRSWQSISSIRVEFPEAYSAKFEVNPEGIDVPNYAQRPLYYYKDNNGAEIKIADDSLVTQRNLNYLSSDISNLSSRVWDVEQNKQDKLTAGDGISITNNVISATGGSGSVEIDRDTIVDDQGYLEVNQAILPKYAQGEETTNKWVVSDVQYEGVATDVKPGWKEFTDYDDIYSKFAGDDNAEYILEISDGSTTISSSSWDPASGNDSNSTIIIEGRCYAADDLAHETPISVYLKYVQGDACVHIYIQDVIQDFGLDGISFKVKNMPSTIRYITLGSKLGTGWVQDREYTVKFKNGKLYLS